MPALRAHISLVTDDRRVQVSASTVPEDCRPDGWRWLQAWTDDGWTVLALHGNADREAVLLLEQHWGDPMRLVAVVTVKEKDDGTIKIKSVSDDVPGIPDDWDKGLYSWTKAGWDFVDISGNREHGCWWVFSKNAPDAT
jgi:hypothetical protein